MTKQEIIRAVLNHGCVLHDDDGKYCYYCQGEAGEDDYTSLVRGTNIDHRPECLYQVLLREYRVMEDEALRALDNEV